MIIVKHKEFILRTFEEADAAARANLLNNKKIWDNCRDGLPYPYSYDDGLAFIRKINSKDEVQELCIDIDGNPAGNIGIVPGTDVERFNAEIGYYLGEPYWNKGLMTKVLAAAIRYYFSNTGIIRLHACVYEYNKPSMHVLEKNGFTKMGIAQKAIFKNGKFWDAHIYELLKEDALKR